MIIVSLSRASRKGRLPPTLFSFTRSLIDPFYLNSPINNNTTKTLDKPPVNLTSLQPKNGAPKYRWTGYFGSLKGKYEFHNLNSSVARMSTSSGMVKTTNNNGKELDAHKELKVELSWIDHYLPNSARPYARLARLNNPIGIWLLAWPCMWSITLAAPPGNLPDFKMLLLFGCGSLLLRGAGCTWNDLIDANIDKKVERTKLRPIASGLVTPFRGLMFSGFQLLMGLEILLQLNSYSQVLGAASLPLVVPYPFMKRFTNWPQAWLAVTYNWGALLGWAAVNGSLDPIDPAIVLPLYSSGVFWTLVYDTIYAHQDKEDDVKVGAKSTALRFGDQTKIWASGFGTACISSLLLSGYNAGIGWPFYVFVMAASGQLAWQIRTVVLSSPTDCNRKFMSNKWFGAIVFSGILVGKLTS